MARRYLHKSPGPWAPYDTSSQGPQGMPHSTGFADVMGTSPTMSVSRPGTARAFMVQAGKVGSPASAIPVDAQGPCPVSLPCGRVYLHPPEAGYLSAREQKEYDTRVRSGQDMDVAYRIVAERPAAPRRQTKTAKGNAGLGSVQLQPASVPPTIPPAILQQAALSSQIAALDEAIAASSSPDEKKKLRKERAAKVKEAQAVERQLKSELGKLAANQGLSETDSGVRLSFEYDQESGELTLIQLPRESTDRNPRGQWTPDGRYVQNAAHIELTEVLAWDRDIPLLQTLVYVLRTGHEPRYVKTNKRAEGRTPGVIRRIGGGSWSSLAPAQSAIHIDGWHRGKSGMFLRCRIDGAGIVEIPRAKLKEAHEKMEEEKNQSFFSSIG